MTLSRDRETLIRFSMHEYSVNATQAVKLPGSRVQVGHDKSVCFSHSLQVDSHGATMRTQFFCFLG